MITGHLQPSRGHPRFWSILAVSLTTIYSVLILLAAACPLDPGPSGADSHRHGTAHHNKQAHSLLCAWACQVFSSAVTADGHAAVPILLLVAAIAASFLLFSASPTSRVQSRAPPTALLSR